MTPSSNYQGEEGISVRESKIILKDVQNNREYLEMREKELEEIKRVSAQVVGITNQMKIEVAKQGEVISKKIVIKYI
jgi:hypothetical protein